jgi:hypothetical protein
MRKREDSQPTADDPQGQNLIGGYEILNLRLMTRRVRTLAEGVGFEPTVLFRARMLSKHVD